MTDYQLMMSDSKLLNRMKAVKNLEIEYLPVNVEEGVVQTQLDKAFNLLFEEVLRQSPNLILTTIDNSE